MSSGSKAAGFSLLGPSYAHWGDNRFYLLAATIALVWNLATEIGARYVTDGAPRASVDCMRREFVTGLQISIRECGDVSVLDLRGRSTIDEGESVLFSKYLRDLVARSKRKLLLNLEDLTHVDSSVAGIIVETFVSLKRLGGELKLLSPRGRVLKVLTAFRLLDVIPTFEDETQAVASFGSRNYSVSA